MTIPKDYDSSPIRSAVIVGGGLAGISAALALARHGIRVQLIEVRSELGGRVGSFNKAHPHDGTVERIDYCQHVGMGCCTNLKQLISWLDQTQDWQTHRQLHFFGPSGKYQKLAAWPLLPAPLHLTGWLLQWPGLKLRDRIRLARGLWTIRKLKPDDAAQMYSALSWLKSQRQTEQTIERFWSTMAVSALGEKLSQVSLGALTKVLQDGFLGHRDAFHLLVPTRPLGELFGSQAQTQLRRLGVEIHLSSPIHSIDCVNPAAMQVTGQRRTWTADALVIAVPWHRLPKLNFGSHVPELAAIAEQASQLQASAITGLHTWWDRRWLELPHATIVGRLCQWVFAKGSTHTRLTEDGTLPTDNALLANPIPAGNTPSREHYYQVVISATSSLRAHHLMKSLNKYTKI